MHIIELEHPENCQIKFSLLDGVNPHLRYSISAKSTFTSYNTSLLGIDMLAKVHTAK